MNDPLPGASFITSISSQQSLDQQLIIDALKATEISEEHLNEMIRLVQQETQTDMTKIKI